MKKLLILYKLVSFNDLFALTNLYCNNFINVKSYFILCDNNIDKEIMLDNNLIKVKCIENNWESILIKVIQSFNFFLKNECEYTHIMITNISTFVNIPNLYEKLSEHIKCIAYKGNNYNFKNVSYDFPSGAGYIFTIDLVNFICEFFKKNNFIVNNNLTNIFKQNFPTTDDIFFGYFFYLNNIKICNLDRFDILYSNIEIKYFNYSYYRIKTGNEKTDYYYHELLYKKIYVDTHLVTDNNYIYKIITDLFNKYIKRLPTQLELTLHKERFLNVHNSSLLLIENEFKNSLEYFKYLKKILLENIIDDDNEQYIDIFIRYKHNKIENFTSFNPIICIKNDKIIKKSNSYLFDTEINNLCDTKYEIDYRIYRSILENYEQIMSISSENYVIKNKCIYLGNAFLDSNIGHACSYIFSIIDRYDFIDKNIKIIITDNTLQNIIKLLLIFINKEQIIQIENTKLYKFENIIIHNSSLENILSIEKYTKTINKILYSELILSHQNSELDNKNILLIKIKNSNSNKFSGCVSYELTDEMYNYMKKRDVIIIHPENICIYKLIYMLNRAKKIVTSTGAISYNHMIYFNKNADLYFIGDSYCYSNILPFKYISNMNISVLKQIF
jgi:hypothetical protein